jgi:hypothetical protein
MRESEPILGATPARRAANDPHLAHLLGELKRLDARLQREVRRWQRAGQDPTDAFRGLYISDQEATSLLDRPIATAWGDLTGGDPSAEGEGLGGQPSRSRGDPPSGKQPGPTPSRPRFQHLAESFGLDEFEREVLLLALAPSLDLRYERIYAYLQDDVTRKRPCVDLALKVLSPPGPARLNRLHAFSREAPLRRHELLHVQGDESDSGRPLLTRTLEMDHPILEWLLGARRPHPSLGPQASVEAVEGKGSGELPDEEGMMPLLEASLDGCLLSFHGRDRGRMQAAARYLAAHHGKPLLRVDLSAATEAEASGLRSLRLALRDATLLEALPYLTGLDPFLDSGSLPKRMLEEVCHFPGPIILGSERPWRPRGTRRTRRFRHSPFPVPDHRQRLELWKRSLQLPAHDEAALAEVAGQFALSSDAILDAAGTALDLAFSQGGELSRETLFSAAREHSSASLSALARKIEPRFEWQDLVLPEDQKALLWEIVHAVRARPQVLHDWKVVEKLASGEGVTVLFAGPPGTGKTMAAEILARELGLDLYVIDLSAIVSKYIGETEKNLERIFNDASSSNAILFFDEADALFGKRSEVRDSHDRYANIEISYLLQRMEAYDGVTILATNLRGNLDEAFTRRLQFAVDFPFPEEEYRLEIWEALFPVAVPHDPDLDLTMLARRFRIAGGNIRNILVGAAYLAAADGGRIRMTHLLHSTRRELQKMGRLTAEGELESSSQPELSGHNPLREG